MRLEPMSDVNEVFSAEGRGGEGSLAHRCKTPRYGVNPSFSVSQAWRNPSSRLNLGAGSSPSIRIWATLGALRLA